VMTPEEEDWLAVPALGGGGGLGVTEGELRIRCGLTGGEEETVGL